MKELSLDDIALRLKSRGPRYYAMYSSWFGGVIRDTGAMLVPIDDHIVHRGDGIFEAMKCEDAKIYALDQHLDRLAISADKVGLRLAQDLKSIRQLCVELVQYAIRNHPQARDCMIRLFNSRGPGGFTTNPYETEGSQLYIVITPFKRVSQEKYETGVSARVSSFNVKESFFANVKSCNYLPNVLMKKEALDAGVDFTISRDELGCLAEGSTENFAIVSEDGRFLLPGFERTLKGVTATRAMALARDLIKMGLVQSVEHAHLTQDDVMRAREAMMLGTTLDCLPVTRFEGQPVGDGRVGPFCRALSQAFLKDSESGSYVTSV